MKLLGLFLLFISFSALAGDAYFICADLELEEEFVVDKYFDSQSEIIKASFANPDLPGSMFVVTFNPQKFFFSARLTDAQGQLLSQTEAALDWYEYELISNRFACKITD